VEVGGAFVRIRPYLSPRDQLALQALHDLSRDLADAFDRFHDRLAASATHELQEAPHDDG
jgi:hypothetical protein